MQQTNFDQLHDGLKRTIYVLVRTDIGIEQQVVQSAHAAAEASRRFYADHHGIASLIVLAVQDRDSLHLAQSQLAILGIEADLFFEPDFEMGHSALATRPVLDDERKLLRQWPLWRLDRVLAAQEKARGGAICA
jgi:hypothetical protein